jgi:hypothetical protein
LFFVVKWSRIDHGTTGLCSGLRKLSLEEITNNRSQAQVKLCEFIAVYEYNLTTAGRSAGLSPAENNPNAF